MKPIGDTRTQRDVWSIPPGRSRHPAAMPLQLADCCIRASTAVGDTVLDPFAGSGTTGLAALLLERRAILIEGQEDFRSMIDERLTTEYHKRLNQRSTAGRKRGSDGGTNLSDHPW